MKISVILPTNRPNGSLYAIHALSRQTFSPKDFELLIVDEDREVWKESLGKLFDLPNVKVLKSKPNHWRSNRLIGNARNTGLIHAEGELVVFLDDFCWVPPRWLEEHWITYQRGPYTMIGAGKAVKYIPDK